MQSNVSKVSKLLQATLFCTLGAGFLIAAVFIVYQSFDDDRLRNIVQADSETPTNAVLSWMIFGNLSLVAGIAFVGAGWLVLRKKSLEEVDPGKTQVSDSRPVYRKVPIAKAPAFFPLVLSLFLYQALFLVACCLSWNRIRENQVGLMVIATIMILCLWYLVRRYRRYIAIGIEQLELEVPDPKETGCLKGQLSIPRGLNALSSPLTIELICEECRNWSPLKEGNRVANIREEYWTVVGQSKPPLLNPFESQSNFPFELNLPAWLPWPWTKVTEFGTVGIVWRINFSGKLEGVKLHSEFVVDNLGSNPSTPAHPHVRIAPVELSKVLFDQGLDWQLDSNQKTVAIARCRVSRGQRLAIMGVGLVVLSVFFFDFYSQWTDGWLWIVSAILFVACVGCVVLNALQYKVSLDAISVNVHRRLLGFEIRRVLPRTGIGNVVVRRIEHSDDEGSSEVTSLKFRVLLSPSDSDARPIALATLRRRFLAKAFAHAIAQELGVVVRWE